jgi:hypothetical protein
MTPALRSLVIGGCLLALVGMGSGCVMHGTPQQTGDAIEYIWNAGDTEKRRKANSIQQKSVLVAAGVGATTPTPAA